MESQPGVPARDELTPSQRTGNVCEERGSKRCTEEFRSSRNINTNKSVGCGGLNSGFGCSRHGGMDVLWVGPTTVVDETESKNGAARRSIYSYRHVSTPAGVLWALRNTRFARLSDSVDRPLVCGRRQGTDTASRGVPGS